MKLKPLPPKGLQRRALREAVATDYRQIIQLLKQALDALLNAGLPPEQREYIDLEAAYPDRVVISRGGKYIAYPYTLADGNVVSLGEPSEVMETYVPVREAQGPAVALLEAIDGGRFRIRVIRAGRSGNNNFYPDAVLCEALALFNGARVFEKSDAEHLKGEGKAFSKLIGGLSNAVFVEGATPDSGEIRADLTLLEPGGGLAAKFAEALDRQLTGLFGFSIDATGTTRTELREGRKLRVATRIVQVKSVDLIVEPGAGGELISLIEAVDPRNQEHTMNREQLLGLLKARAPKAYAKLGANATDDEVMAAFTEALGEPEPAGAGTDALREAQDVLREAQAVAAMIQVRAEALTTIAGCKLPAPAKAKLTARFTEAQRYTAADVDAAIKGEQAYLAQFVESGKVSLAGLDIDVEDRSVAINDMFDAYFDPAHKNHRAVGSFKECYVEVTGDRYVTGRLADCNRSRLRESLGRFAESLDSTSFAQALGDTIARRMQAIYTGMQDLQAWRTFCDVVNVGDFRTQHLTRIGGYGNLPTVAEKGAYVALSSPGDDEATYVVAKRGGLEKITLEMIKNDDRRLIPQIPRELALAAANTLYEFVFDILRTNPTVWDGTALFHATHGNLFTGALSAAEYSKHRLAMLQQVRAGSGKRLNVPPGLVAVPFELEETAYNLFVRGTNLDETFVQRQKPQVISVPYWTDATDWVTLANPAMFKPIEVGFLDGREDPELFVQDAPTVGSLFSSDEITYKIRHIYGSAVKVDGEKGMTKAVVA